MPHYLKQLKNNLGTLHLAVIYFKDLAKPDI